MKTNTLKECTFKPKTYTKLIRSSSLVSPSGGSNSMKHSLVGGMNSSNDRTNN